MTSTDVIMIKHLTGILSAPLVLVCHQARQMKDLLLKRRSREMVTLPRRASRFLCIMKRKLTDGTVFDASRPRGQPFSFTLGKGQVIKGWDQGVEGMAVGEIRRLTIPPEVMAMAPEGRGGGHTAECHLDF